jgi:hypothetical protein
MVFIDDPERCFKCGKVTGWLGSSERPSDRLLWALLEVVEGRRKLSGPGSRRRA